MMRTLFQTLALSALLLPVGAGARTAAAQQPTRADQALQDIRELIQSAEFSRAVEASTQLLTRIDLTAEERNQALEILATAQIANRQQRDAEATLRILYSRDPGHRLEDPDASPPVISAFARAREAPPPSVTVRLAHQTPVVTRRESPELVVGIAEGQDAVGEVRLVFRISGEGDSQVTMRLRQDGTYTARIPVVGDASTATDVAYHIVAVAPSDAELAHAGTAAEPLQLRIPAESGAGPGSGPQDGGTNVAEQWWFWTLLVVLVGGGVAATAILLGPAQEGPEEGTLGSVRLMSIEF